MKMGRRIHLLSGITVILCLQFFQNCGQIRGFEAESEMTGSLVPDLLHPAAENITPPQQKVIVVNKGYVAALMRDIFASPRYPLPAPTLEGHIQTWIMSRPAQFGGACSEYDSYSGRDCGGALTNSSLPQRTDDNTVRHSYLAQFCDRVLSSDAAVAAALEKVPTANPQRAPAAETISGVYQLFDRGDTADSRIVSTLLEMDRDLEKNGESLVHRWRAILLQVCQSPGWQLL